MSAWRKKAIECAPELKKEFEDPELTIYSVFMELLPLTREAHKVNNTDKLKKIYDFAEWCHKQKDKNIWNAVGVSFYEHLADYNETFNEFTYLIKKEIYIDIRNLLNQRIEDVKIKTLDEYYNFKK